MHSTGAPAAERGNASPICKSFCSRAGRDFPLLFAGGAHPLLISSFEAVALPDQRPRRSEIAVGSSGICTFIQHQKMLSSAACVLRPPPATPPRWANPFPPSFMMSGRGGGCLASVFLAAFYVSLLHVSLFSFCYSMNDSATVCVVFRRQRCITAAPGGVVPSAGG